MSRNHPGRGKAGRKYLANDEIFERLSKPMPPTPSVPSTPNAAPVTRRLCASNIIPDAALAERRLGVFCRTAVHVYDIRGLETNGRAW